MLRNLSRSAWSALLLLAAAGPLGADETRTETVRFKAGEDHATLKGKITGRDSVLYTLNARDGQFLTATLKAENLSTAFNVYIPGRKPGDEALYASAVGGNRYIGQLYKDGDHTISVFLIRNAARRGDSTDYELTVRITDEKPEDKPAPTDDGKAGGAFDKTASYDTLKFRVTAAAGGKEFTVTPSGLSASNEPITSTMTGRVVKVFADDLDGDNSPEVAVITESGADQRRQAHLFSTYGRKSVGMVNVPELEDEKLLTVYAGGDEFAIVENTFVRRFPLYQDVRKTGKTRQLQFKLKPGEAMKQLKLDRSVEY